MIQPTDKKQFRIASILAVTFLLITLAVNAAAVMLPLNGVSTKELANKYDSVITPAGLTFSIWSVIYVLLIIWAFRFFIQSFYQKNNLSFLRQSATLTPFFIATCVWNSSWLIAWHHEQLVLSVIIMVMLLITLIGINIRLESSDSLFLRMTFSVYLGWISVATIVNISSVLNAHRLIPFGISQEIWGVILLVIAFLLSVYMSLVKARPAFAFVIAWALYGIYLKNSNVAHIPSTASILSVITLLIAIAGIFRLKKYRQQID